uniref:Protein TRANSPARENT TESTA 12 n=1 Tax=Aegilops tauschii subsp. strangulata TaxID=200361 RepID=A0A453QBV2_AEGTS
MWYYTAVIILVGCLKNPEIQVGAVSICMNYNIWTLMVSVGFNAAVSVRVANELGAKHPKAAKFSVVVAVTTSAAVGLVFTLVTLVARKQLPRLFTDDEQVVKEAAKLGYLLAATIGLNSIQPVLSGVAIGAGWQSLVAWVNIGCYYLIGLPLAAVFGFKLKLNATGDLGGDAHRHGSADRHPVCDPLQNQMAERGYAGRGAGAELGRKRRAADRPSSKMKRERTRLVAHTSHKFDRIGRGTQSINKQNMKK